MRPACSAGALSEGAAPIALRCQAFQALRQSTMGTLKELYRSTIRTCRRPAPSTCQTGEELALRKRCSFVAAMLKGRFRRRADALGRQGSIIIAVVVRFDRDTAVCLWKGAL